MCDGLLDSVCRLCLMDNFSLKRIFNTPCFSNEPLFKIMEEIYDLKICEGDGLPSKICVPCMWKVLEFDTYRKNVRHADEELRKLLSRTCNKSNEVSEEGTFNVTKLTAEGEMNVAKYPIERIDDDTESVKSVTREEVLKDREASNKNVSENHEEQQENIRPEKVTSKVSAGIDFKQNHANIDVQSEELDEFQFSESFNINSSECLGQMDKNFENLSSINNSSVVSTSGISWKNNAKEEMCEESVKNVLFTKKESLLSSKSKSGDNSAKSGSSSSGRAVQSKRKQFVCDLCNKSFLTKLNLGNHVRIHYDDRPFKCRECDKSYKHERSKIEHELRHLKKQKENEGDEKRKTKRSLVCEICRKEFSSQQSLRNHSNLHKNKYSCTFCGKSFGCKHDLIRHLMIHTNEKPFSCEVCKRTFNRKESLKRHLAIHSDDCPFQCNVCDK